MTRRGFVAEILLVARLLLAGVFVLAGVAKLMDSEGSRQSMVDFGVPRLLEWPFVWMLPLAEVAAGAALVPARTAWWGSLGAVAMLLLFITGMSVRLARGEKPDCHCFGKLYSTPIGGKALAREGVLAGLAALIVWQGPGARVGSLIRFDALRGFEWAALDWAAAMTILAAAGVWFAFHLLRQNGRLMLRLETVEASLGIDPAETSSEPEPGLPVDSPAPSFGLESLENRMVSLQELQARGKPVLLVFGEPGCSACEAMLPDLAQSQRGHAERLSIVLISAGDLETNRAKNAQHHLRDVLLQKGAEVSEAYQVTGTPSAVLIRDGKIASPLGIGNEAIRSLLARATLPPAVKKGDALPELRLPDLSGVSANLETVAGRRTMILFWNPGCGYCQQMLSDLKDWEQNRNEESPELLVISAGSLEEIRQQGFRSRVLIDQNFGAGQVFNVEGTPAAVMINEQGRVASEVSVGGSEVLRLAGAENGVRRGHKMHAAL
jgi:methylamine dehydrogenase accessory protein MauD